MPVLTQNMKDMIGRQQCFIGTAGKDCVPNVAPKRSTRVLDDSTLVFTEGTGGVTYQNIQDGSMVSVAVVNREIPDGYRFMCRPEVQTSGELYEQAKELSMQTVGRAPYAVVLLHIEEIQSLKPGPGAGKKIS